MIKEILNQAKLENKFVGIWNYDEDNKFWSGRVIDFNDEFVVIEHYTKYGKPDGTMIQKIALIQSIDFNDGYSEMMEYLVLNHQALDKSPETKMGIPTSENWQFEILNRFVSNQEVVVGISLEGDNLYYGMIHKCNEAHTVLHCISSEGHDDFFSMYKNEDIIEISVNNLDARKRLMLYNWRKNKTTS